MYFCIRVASGPRVKLAGCKSVSIPPPPYACEEGIVIVLFPDRTCFGFMLESPLQGDSNEYPKYMFLGVLNTMLLHNL